MKVLLVYPNMHGMNMLPSAIGLFSSLLKKEGHQVDLFDSTNWIIPGYEDFDSDKEKEKNLNVRPFDDSKLRSEIRTTDVYVDFESKVLSFKPDLLAVSVSEDIFPIGVDMLKKVKHFKIPTIMGGVFPTFAPEKCLKVEEIDMVCIGEGEYALVELCRRMEKGEDYTDITNLWVKKNGVIHKNKIGKTVNMDENPLLDLSLFDESRFYRPMQGKVWKMLPVETHRGCPYTCGYCNSPSQEKFYLAEAGCHFFRKKSIEMVRRELLYYKNEIKAEAYYFWADTFLSYNDKELDEFIEMYQDIKLPFWIQAFPSLIKENKIKKLMNIGLFRLAAGIEHGNEDFRQKVLNRKIKNQTMVDNFKILNKLDLPYSVNNIVGFPTETRELAMDTIELNRLVDADSANSYAFSPFHGTPLRKLAEEKGYISSDLIARSVTKPTMLTMPQFTQDEIEGLRRCFILYVKLPKEKWDQVRLAEKFTPEGNKIWQQLRDDVANNYMNYSKIPE